MMTDKRHNPSISSNHRISLPKVMPAVKQPSNRSISISHNNQYPKKQKQANQSVIVQKNIQIQRLYVNSQKQFMYYLGKGNNEDVVRRVLKTRATWVQSDDSTSAFINLKWQQDQRGFKYNRLVDSGMYRSVLNQLEFHECLCNKENLFKNLEQYCTKSNINIWTIVPPTFILNSKDQVNMQHLNHFFDYFQKYLPKSVKDARPQLQKEIVTYRKKLKSYFFNCNLKKVLPKMPKLTQPFIDSQGQYLWIIKPTFLNRGRGIKVFSKLQTLNQFIQENVQGYVEQPLIKKENTQNQNKVKVDYIKRNSECIKESLISRDPGNRQYKERKQVQNLFDGNQYIRVIPRVPSIIKTDKFLIQKYLQKPLLIKNHKFDIRIWVLVTHNLKCYVFKQGYIRLSSLQYSCKDNDQNSFMHLTNNAIQKFSQGYGTVAEGNQLSFQNLKMYMSEQSLDFQQTKKTIYQQIRISLLSVWKNLNPTNRKYQFQVFGYDFMIDRAGHPWLLEVNNNPCIQQSSGILAQYIPRMLNDAFRLTIDQLFWGSVSSGKFPVKGYSDNQNMWFNLQINEK